MRIHHVIVRVPHPRVHITIELGDEDEHAGGDVEEEGEKYYEEDQAFLARVDSHLLSEVWHDICVLFE